MNVLLNGQLKGSKEAVISVFDHGFLYGMGLFETFRTYGGRIWLAERHAARLAEGCRQLGISYDPDSQRIREGVARLLAANGLEDGYIRWSVSAGDEPLGLPAGGYREPAEIVYAKGLSPDSPASRQPKTLRMLRLRRSSPEGGIRLKSFHYMNNILAKRELAAAGAPASAEGLFLNADGHICEGTVSNVFWLKDGDVYTPSIEAGPLPGITRQYVMELAAKAGYAVYEGLFGPSDILEADQIFLTNSIQEIVPVAVLEEADGQIVRRFEWDVRPSPTRDLMSLYRENAERGNSA